MCRNIVVQHVDKPSTWALTSLCTTIMCRMCVCVQHVCSMPCVNVCNIELNHCVVLQVLDACQRYTDAHTHTHTIYRVACLKTVPVLNVQVPKTDSGTTRMPQLVLMRLDKPRGHATNSQTQNPEGVMRGSILASKQQCLLSLRVYAWQ